MSDKFEMEDEEDDLSAPFWMVTFSDMVTLLLTFFVMLVAMSEVEVQKFREALSHFQGQRGILMQEAVQPTMNQQLIQQSYEQAQRYDNLIQRLEEEALLDKVSVNLTENGVHVVIADSVMFRSGEAELIEPSRTILRLIANLVDEHIETIVVEGHTDDRPISTSRYPSNWELSAARATSVVRFLLEQEHAREPAHYVAVGYGEHRPVNTNETVEGRAANRRVEIKFSWEQWQDPSTPKLQPLQPKD